MGLDFGEKRVGIALTDAEKKMAFAKKVVKSCSALEEIEKIIKEEDVEEIVIGYPLSLKGEKTSSTKKVEDFLNKLTHMVNVSIKLLDERMTTKLAERVKTKKDKFVDHIAAAIILNDYLRRRKLKSSP